MARAGAQRQSKKNTEAWLKFDQKLVLNQWLLGLFEVERLDQLATEALKNPELEGWDEDNISRFHHQLTAQLFDHKELPKDVLLGYDINIVRHWQAITERRGHEGPRPRMKCFQYLSLLFTEIYLDRYFRNPAALLASLNAHVAEFNADKQKADQVEPYKQENLNKLAFMMATGSGKTLLMHVHIRQYLHYLARSGCERELNRIILLTPYEGLSKQHLEEFELSGTEAEIFSKESRGLFMGRSIEIIEVTKLDDEMGDKKVAVDAFEGNNLVMVDEGHRGAGGLKWMEMRNRLCETGFSFEYSATFKQALKAAKKSDLTEEYLHCILFDYSYKYFYRDGYGKNYHILNLQDDSNEDVRQLYLTACLLVFYQQLLMFKEKKIELRRFLFEQPLWVFVASRVTQSISDKEISDIQDILLFLAGFIKNKNESVRKIDRLLKGQSGILDRDRDVFANMYTYLVRRGMGAEAVFSDILKIIFNASSQAALYMENLKGTDGEIALRLGDNEPFGVINVGSAGELCKKCRDLPQIIVGEKEFAGALFHGLNNPDTTVNVLIGAKKFREGWNSWRVSTMGLMNVGQKEGSEIIQLFGRGVRLKGLNFCLKRSQHVKEAAVPKDIETIETLNIFGIRSDYMRQFKEYLEDEGLPANEECIEFILPVIKNLGTTKLRMIRLKEGLDFKKDGPKPTLDIPPDQSALNPIALDWYPKIQALVAKGIKKEQDAEDKFKGKLTRKHLAFLDMNAIYFDLQRYKNERKWYNMNLPREAIVKLLESPDWYELRIPQEELEFTRFDRVRMWQEIAVALLQKYCQRYYNFKRDEWEVPNREYYNITSDDKIFIEQYQILVEESKQEIIATLEQLKQSIENGDLKDKEFGKLKAIFFDRHLYQPLIYCSDSLVEVKPVALNDGERDFVMDLRKFHDNNAEFFKGKELYLLRNKSRGQGIGFFEAGNFYPDFILWLLIGDKQYVSFVDPKGIRNLPQNDPKIQFYKKIKTIEQYLGDANVILNSFILSVTPYGQVSWGDGKMSLAKCESQNVFFKEQDGEHIGKILSKITSS